MDAAWEADEAKGLRGRRGPTLALLGTLWRSLLETRRSTGAKNAVLRSGAACRILLFPSKMKQLQARDPAGKLGCQRDPFFFLTHRHYLSKKLTLAQRIGCALDHLGYEERTRGPAYHALVYRSPGMVLWRRIVDGVQFKLQLSVTDDLRYEGDLSVLLFVDDTRICRMSFSYVNTGVFGQGGDIAMFITRNQTDPNDALRCFRATFKQNSPPYFCLSALCGISMANGMPSLYAVKHDAQIAYDPRFADGFKNSYSAFWLKFAAEEVDHQAYRIAVPLPLAPLSRVTHRARAIARRSSWEEVVSDARRAMLAHRTDQVPASLEEASATPAPPRRGPVSASSQPVVG